MTPDSPATHPASEALDIRECGALRQGAPQYSDKRLYMQLQVFTGIRTWKPYADALRAIGGQSVLYLDVNDPRGIGVLFLSEDPSFFVEKARELFLEEPFASLSHRPEMTMMGRTYSAGREPDLDDWLFHKPRRNALNPEWPWAVWYPLRRKPEFELLPREEQSKMLYEHAKIGISYGLADYAHDIRLACYGLDARDNEFVLGLVGSDLYPLSRVVQDMRKTQQTAKYMQSLGPFFIGKAAYQSLLPDASIKKS